VLDEETKARDRQFESLIPRSVGEMGRPEEIAAVAVLFLASVDDSSYVNGMEAGRRRRHHGVI
jgi:NAD(P)-dependent dehydrogenase (short-subunit alcohol dehydrogenase family)